MLGFGFDVPEADLHYQMKVPVHVITSVRNVSLTPALKPPPIVIKREKRRTVIYFDYDSHILKEREKVKLLKVTGPVRLVGHASPEGTEEYNRRLSEKRAKSVADHLKKRGVQVLEIKGLGEKSCSLGPRKWSLCRKVEVEEE